MRLLLRRDVKTKISTLGKLYVDGAFVCFTLEDRDRGLIQKMTENEIREKKVPAKTAIPEGEYQIIIAMSPHFGKHLPRLLKVPGFDGVLIHSGNTADDSEGCILTGTTRDLDRVNDSRVAFNKLFALLQKAEANQERITIKIESLHP